MRWRHIAIVLGHEINRAVWWIADYPPVSDLVLLHLQRVYHVGVQLWCIVRHWIRYLVESSHCLCDSLVPQQQSVNVRRDDERDCMRIDYLLHDANQYYQSEQCAQR